MATSFTLNPLMETNETILINAALEKKHELVKAYVNIQSTCTYDNYIVDHVHVS